MDAAEELHIGDILWLVEEKEKSYAPDIRFAELMATRYGVELEALIGRSALEHPGPKDKDTIAEQLYHDIMLKESLTWQDFMEVNRTLMNVWFLHALVERDEQKGYDMIVGPNNNSPVRLSYETYSRLREFTRRVLPDERRVQAMELALINADLGKSAAIQADMSEKYQRKYADHDRLILDVAEDDEMAQKWMPAYSRSEPDTKRTILNNFQSGYHMPQGLQGETLTSNLGEFVKMSLDDQLFGLLLGLLDIAGNGGDKVQDRSTTLIEPLVQAFEMQVNAVEAGAETNLQGAALAMFIDNMYLASRAEQWGITLDEPYGRQLARLGCAMRFSNAAQMEDLMVAVYEEMLPDDRDDLMELLGYTGYEPDKHLWIMYLPDLIRVYAEKLIAYDPSFSRQKAFDAGLTMAARTYRLAKQNLDMRGGVVVVARDMVDAYENHPAIALYKNIDVSLRAPGEAWAEFVLAA